uniref:C2 Aida-type domain-containing protein n=1 Tax=Romanomermis culicivorax TaxID=13658 RepID=A0A915JMU8_ROMCU
MSSWYVGFRRFSCRTFQHNEKAMSKQSSTDATVLELQACFEKSLNYDLWGQRLEASAEYRKFLDVFHSFHRPTLDDSVETQLKSIVKNIHSRVEYLDGSTTEINEESSSAEKMRENFREFCKIFYFPKQEYMRRRLSSTVVIDVCSKHAILPPCVDKKTGQTYCTITIDKIGLKDADSYVDPFITISVKDNEGRDLTPIQNTKPSYYTEGKYIIYKVDIYIQKSLEELPKGYAIFFEFNHFKERKKRVSTRCYSFVEADEIKNGPVVCELYKKPPDYTRKKLQLFTEKPLYLHLLFTLNTG